MLIKQIEFVRTNLDNEYRNVVDNYPSIGAYREWLLRNDPNYVRFTPNTPRQIDILDGYADVIADMDEIGANTISTSVYEKNYAIVNATFTKNGAEYNELHFFFVNSYETTGYNQVSFSLQFDSWTYAYNAFIKTGGKTTNIITRRHYNTEYKPPNMSVIRSNGYVIPNDSERVELMLDDTIDERYKVIWLYLRTATNDTMSYTNDDLNSTPVPTGGVYPKSTFKNSIELPILCIPFGLYDMEERKIINDSIYTLNYINGSNYIRSYISPPRLINQNYIVDAWLSFFTPFKYKFNDNYSFGGANYKNVIEPIINDGVPSFNTFVLNAPEQDDLRFVVGTNDDATYEFIIKPLEATYDAERYKKKDLLEDLQINYSGALNAYPNYYKYLQIGNVKFPILNIKNGKNAIFLKIGFSGTSLYAEIKYSNETGKYKRHKFNFQFKYPISIDAYNDFLSRNSNSIEIARGMSLVNGTIGAINAGLSANTMSNLSKSFNGFGSYLSSYGAEKDVKNAVDSYTDTNDFGINKVDEFLDYPIVYLSKPNKHSLEESYRLFKFKGVPFDEIGDVFANYRMYYDYVETVNCSLPNIPYDVARKELEKAFDRGVTKWHYNSDDEYEEYVNIVDYNINNYQVNLEV